MLKCAVLIWNLILKQTAIDYRRLLEQNRATPNGTVGSRIPNPTIAKELGSVGHLLVNWLQSLGDTATSKIGTPPDHFRPCVNYYTHKFETDPFAIQGLVDMRDADQAGEEKENIFNILRRAKDAVFPNAHFSSQNDLL